MRQVQYIPRNMHTVFALLCIVVVIHWLIFPYPSGLLHWHCGNLTIAPVPAREPWWIWINTSCEFIMNDCITTTKQSTTKPCAYFLGYTVCSCHDVMMSSVSWLLFSCGGCDLFNDLQITLIGPSSKNSPIKHGHLVLWWNYNLATKQLLHAQASQKFSTVILR